MKAKRIILFFLLLSALIPTHFVESDPGWFAGWNYRKSHIITGTVAGAQTDYQMKIIIDYGAGVDSGDTVYVDGKCRTDFGDIRFTESDGVTEIIPWLDEKVNSDYALFWAPVPSIPENPDNATIYVYYGNAGASTTSDGSATFPDFFEDFEDGTLGDPPAGWTNDVDFFSVQDDYAYHGNKSVRLELPDALAKTIYKAVSDISGKFVLEYAMRRDTISEAQQLFTYSGATQATWLGFAKWGGLHRLYYYDTTYRIIQTYDADTWYKIGQVMNTGTDTYDIYVDDVLKTSGVDFRNVVADIDSICIRGYDDVYGWFDRMLIRKYASPEPTHGEWGEEEISLVLEAPASLFGAGFNASSPFVNLRWASNLTDIGFFEIQNSTDKIAWDYLGQSPNNSYNDFQVVNGTERYYRVRACNFTGAAWDNSTFTDIDFETVYYEIGGAPGPGPAPSLFPGLAIGIAILIIAYAYSETRR